MVPGTHGSTYGCNPLAVAIVDKVLDLFTAPGFLNDVARKGAAFETRLNDLVARHPRAFSERRGKGMMQGLRCIVPEEKVIAAARARKLLIMPAGDNIVRLVPPLIVEEKQIDTALEILDAVAQEVVRAA